MPCTRSKTKKQPTKRTMKETVKQNKRMQGRLMVISVKAVDYIHKKKPISIQEADMYVREMEEFRDQCQDDRYIQVIKKLTKCMKCIIREQSPKDIVDVNILSPVGNPIEEIHNKNEHVQNAAAPEYNAIIDTEMERSLLNLSIVDHKDPLAISVTNDNDTYQKNAIVHHSASAITKENLNEVKNQRVAYTNKKSDVCNLNDRNEQSQNIRNFEYENYASLGNLRTFRYTKTAENKQIQQAIENVTDNMNIGNTNQSEIINVNDIHEKDKALVDDSSEQSQNLLNNFEYVNYSSVGVLQNISNPQKNYQTRDSNETANNIADNIVTGYSHMNTGNRRTRLEEVINLNAIKQKELGCDSNKISQKILNHFDYGNHTVASVHQNNPKNYQPLHNKIPDNIIDARYKVINFNKANTGHSKTTSKFNDLNAIRPKEKELGGESNKLSQNLRNSENKTKTVIGILKNNTNSKNYQTQQIFPETHYTSKDDNFLKINQIQHNTFKPPKSYNVQDNTIFKNIRHNIIETPKKIQHKMANDSSQNQGNVIGKVKRRRRNVNKDIIKTAKKKTYNRKNKGNVLIARNDLSKEETVYSAVQDAKNPGNSANNSIQKNQHTISENKKDEIDISWVENMKFVRAIETDEYFKFDNVEESFWTITSIENKFD